MVADKGYKRFIPLIITLLIALFLFFLVKDFLRTVILVPLLYVIWFVVLVVESLPQGVIWGGLLLVIAYIAYASLKKDTHERLHTNQLPYRNSGEVEKWLRFLDQSHIERYTKWRLAMKLKQLTQKLLNPLEGNVTQRFQDDIELPEEIAAFFEAQQPTIKPFWERFGKKTNSKTDSALDLDTEVVIQYLEKQIGM